MEWYRIEKLKSVELIDEFERKAKYKFCDSYRKFIIENNGGEPEEAFCYETESGDEHSLRMFLSFNKEDWNSIFETFEGIEWFDEDFNPKDELRYRYIIFAEDDFGNHIAFDSTDNSVVFVDHETYIVDKIADDFDGFLEALYEVDDDEYEYEDEDEEDEE